MCETEVVANDVRHTLIKLKEWAKPEKPEKRLVNLLDGVYRYKDPYGVVLIIGAWNYPLLLTLGPLVGEIFVSYCVVCLKTATQQATANLSLFFFIVHQ